MLLIVGIRNYLPNGEDDYPSLFSRVPVGTTVFLRKEPKGSRYAGCVSVWDDENNQIGCVSKTKRRFIELEIPEGEMLPAIISGHSAEHHCMYVVAQNTKGFADPEIRTVKPFEGETVFSMTGYDKRIQQLTSMMKTKLRMLKDGKMQSAASLMSTGKEYVKHCISSLDGNTTFDREEILMSLESLMTTYPELEALHSAIYEKHKDINRRNHDVLTQVYLDQFNRIRENALKTSGRTRSQTDDYLAKLRFAHGGRWDRHIIEDEVMKLSSSLAMEKLYSNACNTATDETFAEAIYSLNYTMDALYCLYSRRIKLEILQRELARVTAGKKAWEMTAEVPAAMTESEVATNDMPYCGKPQKAADVQHEKHEVIDCQHENYEVIDCQGENPDVTDDPCDYADVTDDPCDYPDVTDVQRDFFERAYPVKVGGMRKVLDMPVERIMHTIYRLTKAWRPNDKESVHKWKLLYEVLRLKRCFRIVKRHRYLAFVKAVVRYRFPDVDAVKYCNNISKTKLKGNPETWKESDRKLNTSLWRAFRFME